MENNLNKWFTAAKEAEPVVGVDEIKALITKLPVAKSGWSFSQKGMFVGTVFLLVLSWWYWSEDTQQVVKAQQEGTKQTEVAVAEVLPTAKESEDVEVQMHALEKSKNSEQKSVDGFESATYTEAVSPSNLDNGSMTVQPASVDLTNRILYLDDEELKALDIVIEKGAYNYYYKTYSFRNVIKATQLRGVNDSFYFTAGKPGKNYFIKPWETDFHPLYLTDSLGNHQRNFHFQDRLVHQNAQAFNDSLRNLFATTYQDLIPVGIRTPDKGYLELLWYKPTQAFIKKLPSRYAILYTEGSFANRGGIRSNETSRLDGGNVYLNNEELAALGIITDGNVLTYANITDSVLKIEDEGIGYSPSFQLTIEKHGSSESISGIDNDGKIAKQSKRFWPACIQMIKPADTSLTIVEYLMNSYKVASDFFEEAKPYLIPIEVHLKAKPGILSRDLILIFWFKPEPEFLEALPVSIRNTLSVSANQFETYCKILRDYRWDHKMKTVSQVFDSLHLDQLVKKAKPYTNEQLKDIFGIKLTEKGFTYSNTQKVGRSKVRMKVGQVEISTYIDINKTFFGKVGPKPYTACAMTRLNMAYIGYLYVYPASVKYSQRDRESASRFSKEVKSLVPVVVGGCVLWFPPHPELLKKLEALKP